MIKRFVIYFLLMIVGYLLISCNSTINKKDKFYAEAKSFYQIADKKNLDILFNLEIVPREYNEQDSTYKITRIAVNFKDGTQISIPAIKGHMSEKDIKNSPFYENMQQYAELMLSPDSASVGDVLVFSRRVTQLYDELGAIEIHSKPQLGRFLIFKLSPELQVIYVPDTSLVNTKYWRSFFQNGEKLSLDNKWYYRKSPL